MDIAYRLSGGMDYRPVACENGINIVENHLEYALCGEWNGDFMKCDKPFEHCYITICIGLKNGHIQKIEGLDEVKKLPYVYDLFQYYNEGDVMSASGRFQQTFYRIFIREYDKDSAFSKINDVMNMIEVYDENDVSMMLDYIIYKASTNEFFLMSNN